MRFYRIAKEIFQAALILGVNRFASNSLSFFSSPDLDKRAKYIIAIDLPQANVDNLPSRLREVLNFPQLKTKALRMGKVIRVQMNKVRYYDRDKQVRNLK